VTEREHMLLKDVAEAQDINVSELVRRALTNYIRQLVSSGEYRPRAPLIPMVLGGKVEVEARVVDRDGRGIIEVVVKDSSGRPLRRAQLRYIDVEVVA